MKETAPRIFAGKRRYMRKKYIHKKVGILTWYQSSEWVNYRKVNAPPTIIICILNDCERLNKLLGLRATKNNKKVAKRDVD